MESPLTFNERVDGIKSQIFTLLTSRGIKGIQMSNSDDLNAILEAHKKTVKIAHETAARTGTLLVSRQGDKVVMVKPNVKYLGFVSIN